MFWFWLILFIILFLFVLYLLQFKKIKFSCVHLTTGAPKTGKSLLSIWLAVHHYKSNVLKWYITKLIIIPIVNGIRLLFKKEKLSTPLKPMLYSNIPLANVTYNDLSLKIIKREVRIPNKSVVFIDEASLIADSMSFKDAVTNEQVSLFVKLFGHYTHGGKLIYNTQDLQDMHFGFKRCTGSMLWIHSKVKLPFFSILKVRELISLNDDNVKTSNDFNEDIEVSCMKLVVPNKYMWYYDCYAFSSLTDDKEMLVDYEVKKKVNKRFKRSYLKTNFIVSFKNFLTFKNERRVKVNESKKN